MARLVKTAINATLKVSSNREDVAGALKSLAAASVRVEGENGSFATYSPLVEFRLEGQDLVLILQHVK